METLIDYLKVNKPKRFVAKPYYSGEADSLVFYFRDEPSYAKRVDDFLTVYLSIETEKLVGCQVKGLAKAIKLLGEFGFVVEDKSVRLGMIFMACMATTPTPTAEVMERYRELGRIAKEAVVPQEELRPAFA